MLLHEFSIRALQREAAFLYEMARGALELELGGAYMVAYQERAAALSFAARVLARVESPLPPPRLQPGAIDEG